MQPYYVFLRRPDAGSTSLRLHRSTVPAWIRLPALTARFLPETPACRSDKEATQAAPTQDLPRLVHELRRALVSYHLGRACIARLGQSMAERASSSKDAIERVSDEDGQGRDVRLEWRSGRIGRIRLGTSGCLQKCVVFGGRGRERAIERQIMAGKRRVEHLAETLGAMDVVS